MNLRTALLAASIVAIAPASLAQTTSPQLPFPSAIKAREQAKAQNKPSLIIWHGSNWMQNRSTLYSSWKKLGAANKDYIIGQFDEKVGTTDNERKEAMPIENFNLPVAVVFAPDGTFMACFDSTLTRDTEKLAKALKTLHGKSAQFSKLIEEGKAEEGVAGATKLGEALRLLRVDDALRSGEIFKLIDKKDPEDQSGYRAAFTTPHMPMYGEINKILRGGQDGKLEGKDRKFDAAEQYVRKALKHDFMPKERRQQWLAGLAYIQRQQLRSNNSEGDRKPLLSTYKQIIEIDSKSEYGKGARNMQRYWDPNYAYSIKNMYYDSANVTLRIDKEWKVDVSKSVKKAGSYEFKLHPVQNGRLICRNYRIAINGKVVGKADLPADKDTKSVELVFPAIKDKDKVEVWMTTQCNDGWLNCSGKITCEPK